MRIPSVLIALFAAPVLFTPMAQAEEEEKQDISEEIKAQMDEILELMKSNQDALLELSTGKDAKPKRVDVKVPVPPDDTQQPNAQGDGQPGSGSTSGGSQGGKSNGGVQQGESAARKIEELLGAQQTDSKRIPGAIEKLLKMIPT